VLPYAHNSATRPPRDNGCVRTFFKDESVFLDAQSTQASADNVIIRRLVVLGGDPIDVAQEAVHGKKGMQNIPNEVELKFDRGEEGGGICVSIRH